MECLQFTLSQGGSGASQCREFDDWVPQCAASYVLPQGFPHKMPSILRPSPSFAKLHDTRRVLQKRLLQHGGTTCRIPVRAAAAASSVPSPEPDSQLQQTLNVAKWLSSIAVKDDSSGPLRREQASMEGTLSARSKALAQAFATQLSGEGRAALLAALYPAALDSNPTALQQFAAADANSDGVVDATEFAAFLEAQLAQQEADYNRPLTQHQLLMITTRAAIGNVGFGITDNAIMLTAGDLIEKSLGASFGVSTLLAAGLGNAVSDVVGTLCREYIEGAASTFLPEINLSSAQLGSKAALQAEMTGACVGVTVGCLIGLLPLLILPVINRQEGDSSGTACNASSNSSGGGSSKSNTEAPPAQNAAVATGAAAAVELRSARPAVTAKLALLSEPSEGGLTSIEGSSSSSSHLLTWHVSECQDANPLRLSGDSLRTAARGNKLETDVARHFDHGVSWSNGDGMAHGSALSALHHPHHAQRHLSALSSPPCDLNSTVGSLPSALHGATTSTPTAAWTRTATHSSSLLSIQASTAPSWVLPSQHAVRGVAGLHGRAGAAAFLSAVAVASGLMRVWRLWQWHSKRQGGASDGL